MVKTMKQSDWVGILSKQQNIHQYLHSFSLKDLEAIAGLLDSSDRLSSIQIRNKDNIVDFIVLCYNEIIHIDKESAVI